MVNGYLVGKFKLPPFIATLGTMFVTRGIAYMVNRQPQHGRHCDRHRQRSRRTRFQNFFYYGKDAWCLQHLLDRTCCIFIIFFFILSQDTLQGVIFTQSVPTSDAAKLSGVNVVRRRPKTYLVSSVCSCIVGLILCAQAGMGNMEAGNMYEMYGVAAGVIGGVSPLGGTGLLARNVRRCSCMADAGKRSEHDRRTGRHPASRNRS
ncbi:MAG: ABC transporter permease subunit [Ruminococcus sp.]